MLFLFLFFSFFQAGLLGLGGTPGATAWLEYDILSLHRWLTPGQLTDLMVACRFLPGGTGLNTATLTGALTAFGRYGFWGGVGASAVSVIGLCIPSFIWTEVVVRLKERIVGHTLFSSVSALLRLLVPGLILAASILLMRPDNFGTPSSSPWQFYISLFLFVSTLIGRLVYRFNEVFLIVLCGIAGWILF